MTPDHEGRSIFRLVQAAVDSGEAAQLPLPDDHEFPKPSSAELFFLASESSYPKAGDDEAAADLFALVRDAATGGPLGQHRFARLYERAKGSPPRLAAVNLLLERIRGDGGIDRQRLHQVALRLATQATHRCPVKLGIALLGLFPVESHREVLLTLGSHEEFTRYAVTALISGQDDPYDDLWLVAKRVHGLGRIEAVWRLAMTDRADILDWILREGFRNGFMVERLAHLAASRGDLLAKLNSDAVDDELLFAAGELIRALLAPGSEDGIDAYPDGAEVIRIYLSLVADRPADMRHLLAIGSIRQFVTDAPEGKLWPGGDWFEPTRARLAADCDRLLDRPEWVSMARQAIDSEDPWTFYEAQKACAFLGISTLDALLARLRQSPLWSTWWSSAIGQADHETVHRVVDLAVQVLPLADIASGPGSPLEPDSDQAAYCLARVIDGLHKWPGAGWSLVAAALASPDRRSRWAAVDALRNWPRNTWPAEAERHLQAALSAETEQNLRERMLAALDRH